MEEFWIRNPSILFRKYEKIIPEKKDSMVETLNILTRLCIYLFMISYMFNISSNISIVSLMMIVILIIYHEVYVNNSKLIAKDLTKDEGEREKFTEKKEYNFNSKKINKLYDDKNKDKNIEIHSGYIDFDGEHIIGRNNSSIDINNYLEIEDNERKDKLSYDKYRYVIDKIERKPEINNPFRNIRFSDYLEKDKSLPNNMDKIDREIYDFKREEKLNKEGEKLYNSSIYRNIEDVFNRENSQRIFMTQPIKQTPNSQKDFAEWLYKRDETCKENTEKCTFYEIPNMQSPRY